MRQKLALVSIEWLLKYKKEAANCKKSSVAFSSVWWGPRRYLDQTKAFNKQTKTDRTYSADTAKRQGAALKTHRCIVNPRAMQARGVGMTHAELREPKSELLMLWNHKYRLSLCLLPRRPSRRHGLQPACKVWEGSATLTREMSASPLNRWCLS